MGQESFVGQFVYFPRLSGATMASSNKFICLTCQISFEALQMQKDHYKSEWHLYNLKRKLTNLVSISEKEFNQIKLTHQQQQSSIHDHNGSEQFYCKACRKNFFNEKAFNQHNSSQKHVLKSSALLESNKKSEIDIKNVKTEMKFLKSDDEEESRIEIINEDLCGSDWEEVESDEEILEFIPVNECLFCVHKSSSIETNLSHMSLAHSFFIPDLEYCNDLKGLLIYLGTKISSGHCCLWCSDHGKSFASKKSAQQHMIDVGHTKINFYNRPETILEFEDFYDYTSSYPDASNEEDGDEVETPILDDSDYELRLPSGAVIGHRSLMVYYKQKLRPIQAGQRTPNTKLLNKVANCYKSLGWTGSSDSSAMQIARDMHYINRISKKLSLKIGEKHNRAKQKHFRSQIGF